MELWTLGDNLGCMADFTYISRDTTLKSQIIPVFANSKRLLMKIPGNQPIFYLWPIQKLPHLGIPIRV